MTQAPDGRTPAQVADEQAMAHVSAVLTNLDWTIERARKGLKELRKSGSDEGRNAELALTDLLAQLGDWCLSPRGEPPVFMIVSGELP